MYFVSALTLPSIDIKEYVLDSLFEILHEKVPAREDPFSVMTTSKTGGRDLALPSQDGRIEIPPRFVRHNLIDNFLAAQIQALIEAGLAGGLVELESQMRKLAAVTGSDSRENVIAIKATILLGSVLALSNTLLPSQQCARLQTLEELVKRSLRFHGDPQIRSRASTMVTNLHMFSQKNKGQDTSGAPLLSLSLTHTHTPSLSLLLFFSLFEPISPISQKPSSPPPLTHLQLSPSLLHPNSPHRHRPQSLQAGAWTGPSPRPIG